MILGVVHSEGDVMRHHFFGEYLRINADTYRNDVTAGRNYILHQDLAFVHNARRTQAWFHSKLAYHWFPNLWPYPAQTVTTLTTVYRALLKESVQSPMT